MDEWIWSTGSITWTRKSEVFGEKSVPVPLSPPQITHALAWDQTRVPQWQVGDYPTELWYGVLCGNFGMQFLMRRENTVVSRCTMLHRVRFEGLKQKNLGWEGRGRRKTTFRPNIFVSYVHQKTLITKSRILTIYVSIKMLKRMKTKNKPKNAQINSGLIYYWWITPTCFGPSVEAIIREFEILESYKAIVLIC